MLLTMTAFNLDFDRLPSGWVDQSVYTFKGPLVDGLEHLLIVTLDRRLPPDATTLAPFVEQKSSVIRKSYPESRVMKDGAVTLDNTNAHELVLEWPMSETLTRIVQYYFAIVENTGFTFWSTYADVSFSLLRSDVRKLVVSLLAQVG